MSDIISKTPGSHAVGGNFEVGGAIETSRGSISVPRVAKAALLADTGAGGVLAWLNPEGRDVLVHDVILDVTTEATGAATVDVGVAADGTTSSDNLLDGADIGAAAATLSSANDAGTNGGSFRRLASGEYVTATAGSDPAGLVGSAYIVYTLL